MDSDDLTKNGQTTFLMSKQITKTPNVFHLAMAWPHLLLTSLFFFRSVSASDLRMGERCYNLKLRTFRFKRTLRPTLVQKLVTTILNMQINILNKISRQKKVEKTQKLFQNFFDSRRTHMFTLEVTFNISSAFNYNQSAAP